MENQRQWKGMDAENGSDRPDMSAQSNYNSSDELPIDMQFNDGHLLSIVVYSILFVIATIGNITVLIALLKFRLKPRLSRVNLFLLHLVIADLMVTFLLMPLEIGWAFTVAWKAGDLACRVLSFFRTFGLYLSGFLIVSISIDRYNAVLQPLSLPEANRRGRIMLYCAWIGSIICSIPQALIFHVERHPQFEWFEQCVTFNFFPNERAELAYSLFGFVLMYGLPLCTILFCYSKILYEIYTINRISKNGGDSTMRRSNLGALGRAKVRTLKLTITIVCTFFFCWTPYNVMSLWYWIDKPSAQQVDQRIQKGLFLFACTNSCFNPMVYGLFHTRSKSFWVRITAQKRNDLKQNYNNTRCAIPTKKEQPYKVRVRWTPRECLCGTASSSGYMSSSASNLRMRPLYEINGIPVFYNNIGTGSIIINKDFKPQATVSKSLVKTVQVDVNDCVRNGQLHSNSITKEQCCECNKSSENSSRALEKDTNSRHSRPQTSSPSKSNSQPKNKLIKRVLISVNKLETDKHSNGKIKLSKSINDGSNNGGKYNQNNGSASKPSSSRSVDDTKLEWIDGDDQD